MNALPFPLPAHSGSIPVVKTCNCPPFRNPDPPRPEVYRILQQFVAAFEMPDDEPLFNIRCRSCGKVLVISAGDVRAA